MGNGGGSLTAHVAPPVLCDQLAVLVEHHQHRDAGDSKVLLEGLDRVGAVLDAPPVPVRLLHVGHHGILRLVRRHKDNLDAVNLLQKLLLEVTTLFLQL